MAPLYLTTHYHLQKSANTIKHVHAKPGMSARNESMSKINTFAQVGCQSTVCHFSVVKRMTSFTQPKIFQLKVQQGCTWIIISDNTELKIAQDRTQTNKRGLHRKLFYSLIEYNALVPTSYF